MTSAALPAPLTDSLDIAYWICEQVPALLGGENQETIKSLVTRLHQFHAVPLSVSDEYRKKHVGGMPSDAEDVLKKPDLSESYRKALEFKVQQ
jgi:hypothetical protein